jgi:hypothetical protein
MDAFSVTRFMTYSRKGCKISVWEELWSAISKWTETPGPLHFAYEVPGLTTKGTHKSLRDRVHGKLI